MIKQTWKFTDCDSASTATIEADWVLHGADTGFANCNNNYVFLIVDPREVGFWQGMFSSLGGTLVKEKIR